ncbi:unnamed protein product [Cunninghamella blakesleeana]
MSDITLSTTTNQYDYMVNINPSIVQKNDSPTMNTSPPVSYDETQQQYAYHDYAFQQMSLAAYPTVYPMNYYDHRQPQQRMMQHPHPNSPDSISSSSSPPTPPSTNSIMHRSNTVPIMHSHQQPPSIITSQVIDPITSSPSPMMNPLMTTSNSTPTTSSSSTSTSSSTTTNTNTTNTTTTPFTNTTTARVKETIARANSVPMEFYHTEFLEYSKETYERKMDAKKNKRKRSSPNGKTNEDQQQKKKKLDDDKMSPFNESNVSDDDDDFEDDDNDKLENKELSSAELRRQIHIQSEQKRRAQIKDGFDELRKYLPGCNNKKMSKAALLTRTVQQIQHMKKVQNELLAEVERLVQENDNLKKFQHNVLQRQAMEKMYSF